MQKNVGNSSMMQAVKFHMVHGNNNDISIHNNSFQKKIL